MRKCIVVAIVSLFGLLFSCQPKQGSNYTLSGSVADMSDGDTLYLLSGLSESTRFDTLFVSHGRFHTEGFVEEPSLCFLYSARSQSIISPFFLEPGVIDIDYSSPSGGGSVSGTVMNDALQALNDSVVGYGSEMNAVMTSMHSDSPTKDQQQAALLRLDTLSLRKNQYLYLAAEQNITNELGYAILTYFDDDSFSREQRQSLISQLPASMRSRPRIQEMEQALSEPEGVTTLPDLRLSSSLGNNLSLLEEVGKNPYTIIEFWASWSTAAQKDMPKLSRLYHRYRDRGVGMISISLDLDANDWRRSIERMGPSWLQLCDTKGWEGETAESLHLHAIPHTILVDSSGKVLASGLSADELDVYLEQVLF